MELSPRVRRMMYEDVASVLSDAEAEVPANSRVAWTHTVLCRAWLRGAERGARLLAELTEGETDVPGNSE